MRNPVLQNVTAPRRCPQPNVFEHRDSPAFATLSNHKSSDDTGLTTFPGGQRDPEAAVGVGGSMRVRLGGSATLVRAAQAPRLPAAYDLLDVPTAAGHRVLLQLERLGTPLGPVLTVQAAGTAHEGRFEARGGASRLRFFVEAGTTASFLADLKDLGWEPADTDIRTIGVVPASEMPLPAATSPCWVRPPEGPTGTQTFSQTQPERTVALPPARLLLGALAHACRRAGQRRSSPLFAGSRSF